MIADEARLEPRHREAVAEFIGEGYRSIFNSDFMTIYERPGGQRLISEGLIEQWEAFKKQPPMPYRTIIRLGYQYALAVVSFLFLILLAIRQLHREKIIRSAR